MNYVDVHNKTLMVTNPRSYGVLKSAIDILYQEYNSSSFSNSSYNTVVNVPTQVVVSNRIYQTVRWRLDFEGNATVGPNLLPTDSNGNLTYCAFRAFALDNMSKSTNIQIQNMNFSENVNRYASAILPHFETMEDLQRSDQSGQPTQGDNSSEYTLTDLTNISPFSPYYDNPAYDSRASFPVEIVSNTPTTASVIVSMTGPLKCSPLCYGRNQTFSGFLHVNQINIQQNWDSQLASRLFSASPALDITNIEVNCLSASVNVGFYTPRSELRAMYPSKLLLPYFQTLDYITSMPEVPAGGRSSVICNNVELNVVPNSLFVWIDRRINDKTINTTDTFFEIEGITITMDGKSGILSSATEWQLYNISEDNNFAHTYRDWQCKDGYGSGSVLCLKFGKDIPLRNGIAPGSSVRSNIQVQIDFRNPHDESVTPQCNLVVVNEGVVQIDEFSGVSVSVGMVSEEDYALASSSMLTMERNKSVMGAGLWDRLKWMARKAVSFVAPRARQALESGQMADALSKFAPSSVQRRGQAALELARRGSQTARSYGYGMTGGAKLPKRNLKY